MYENDNSIYYSIGLKNCLKPYKGCKLSYKLKRLYWNLRYSCQRAWRGYGDVDMFECFEIFRCRMILVLEEFKKNSQGIWILPKESEHYDELLKQYPKGFFSEEAMQTIFDIMIWHLKMMSEDFVEKQLYGKCIFDDNYDYKSRTIKDYKRISSVMDQNKNCFMKLFSMFYYDLWD